MVKGIFPRLFELRGPLSAAHFAFLETSVRPIASSNNSTSAPTYAEALWLHGCDLLK